MKVFKSILFHPVTVCILFCFLLISGESNGTFYFWILLIGLPHGVLHSILGIVGIILLLASLFLTAPRISYWLRIAGILCFVLSLLRFFTQPGGSYNAPTFHQTVPLAILFLFISVLLLFLIHCLRQLNKLRRTT